ncbi:acetylornithine aminotransferase [Penicillium sp. IBT 16267x]|nr:acetylornithine aminotransferase [Penicillium sp. IBT 16267x]
MNPASSSLSTAVQTKLNTLIQKYEQAHPKSKKAFERAQKVLPAGSTRSVLVSDPFPMVVQSAQGATFTTVDSVTFVDFVSDYSAGIYGHSHPVIHDAVRQALSTGFSLGGITEKEAELAEILIDRFPSMDKVRFCNSGTEANTFAIATAMAYTQRKKFVMGTYNDIDATRPLIENLAAILVEPLQAAGGMRPATPEFLSFLREAASQTGTVLIFDEVVTSRLDYHGLQGYWNIIPDMTTAGKYLGGGFPFGAFGGSAKIMDRFDSTDKSIALHHSGTFNNNIFTMCAAVSAANLITQEELRRLNGMGDRFREQASLLIQDSGFKEMEFSGEYFYFTLIHEGISIGRRGFMSLNLMHTEASIDRLLKAVSVFLGDIAQ